MMFLKEYKPKKIKKTNVLSSRKKIFGKLNQNLQYLLEKRFTWINKIIKNKQVVIELGSGNGCIKRFIKKRILLTDITKYSWINKKIDMSKINLGKKYFNKVDIFIINHSLHHCSNPFRALKKMLPYLKKNGLILINEPEASLSLRIVQIILDDEGFSLSANVFGKKEIFNPKNPWVSNTAVAHLLFRNEKKFNKHFPQYKIKMNKLSEFFIFFNSGGVNTDIFKVPLNKFFLDIVDNIDKFLIKLFPRFFALNRSIILQKK